jgi:hypothetical protein
MIPKMGRDSQGSTFIYALLVHLCSLSSLLLYLLALSLSIAFML